MVKPVSSEKNAWNSFESDVIPDSGKTNKIYCGDCLPFESDVIPDSGKTTHVDRSTK